MRPPSGRHKSPPNAINGARLVLNGVRWRRIALAEHHLMGKAEHVQEMATPLRITLEIVEFEDRHSDLSENIWVVFNKEQLRTFNIAFEQVDFLLKREERREINVINLQTGSRRPG